MMNMCKVLKKSWLVFFVLELMVCAQTNAQVATGYEVGTWYGFKTAAITYSFDDGCSNQIPNAMPLFDKYGYKISFNVVTSWVSNWSNYQAASLNGHEIASHTVTHATLSNLSAANQDPELKNSQATINSNITNAKCLSIIYPNCTAGDVATMSKYYICGRTCSGQVNSNSLTDFWNISSFICGASGTVITAQNFNDKVASAKSAKGWAVFLIHGVDNDGGYSSLSSSELSSHLVYVNTNSADYWVATFLNVVKYIKERTAASLKETTITSDSLKAVITDGLDNTIYDAAITVRRVMPTGWAGAKVYLDNTVLASTTTTVNGVTYVVFNVAPDKGNVYLVNTTSTVVATPTVTSPVLYCKNATATALTATGTSLKWYTQASGGTALATAPIPSTTATGSTTYYVSQTLSGTESSRASITVTVNALPTISAGSDVTICKGTATTLTATGGTSYKWSNSVSTASNGVTPTATTTYSVTGTNTSSCSATSSVIVTINAIPNAPTVTTPVTYYQNTTAIPLTATGTLLKWYTSNSGGTSSSIAPTPITTTVGSTDYFVSQTQNLCESPKAQITVVVNPQQKVLLKAGWNYIGCPISGSTAVSSALSSIWTNVEVIKNLDVFYSTANPVALNTLTNVQWGQGYFVKVSTACYLDWIVR